MKNSRPAMHKHRPILPVPAWGLGDEEPEFFRDVYLPDFDPLPGETPVAFKLRFTFTCAGYRTTRIEEVATHPVVVIRTMQPDTGRIADQWLLMRNIRDLLCRAGFRPKRDELTVARSGHRVLIAFQTGKWTPNFEEILREPHEDMVDHADMAL